MHALDRRADGQTDERMDGRTDSFLVAKPRCIQCMQRGNNYIIIIVILLL